MTESEAPLTFGQNDDRRYLSYLRVLATCLFAVVGVMYVAMAFSAASAWIQTIDDRFFTMAVDGEVGLLVSVAKLLSFVGSSAIMFPFVMVVAGYLYWKNEKTTALFWLSALAVTEALIWGTKIIYARPRPPLALVTTHSYSFPSGHAGTAAAVAVGLVLLLAINGSRHWYFNALAILYMASVGWSRVYLRAHWLSDVITGAVLGSAVVIAVYLVVASLARHDRLPLRAGPERDA